MAALYPVQDGDQLQSVDQNHYLQSVDHDIASGRLYKTFLLCSDLEKYIQIEDLSTMTCQTGFVEQINRTLDERSIFFHDENPRDKHQFATPTTVMVTLIVPQDFIICVDGRLSLKHDCLTEAHVLGVYLFRDSDQFFNNANFTADSLRDQ